MDFTIFNKAKELFDFGYEQTVQNLPDNIEYFLKNIDIDGLLPIANALHRDIDSKWDISLCDLSGHGYDMDLDHKILFIDSKGLKPDSALSSIYFAPQLLASFIEGLRMVRHVEWLDNALERYHPESIIKIGRICMADSITQTIYTAWQLRDCDEDAMWKHLLCGQYSDMAQCFDRVMERCLTQGMDEGNAIIESLSLTFRTWFTDEERVRVCDHDSLDVIDDLMEQGVKIGHRQIDKAAIVCLTHQIGGEVTYLSQDLVHDILRNPFYGEIDNFVNHTHLSQIIRDNASHDVAGIPFRDAELAQRFALT